MGPPQEGLESSSRKTYSRLTHPLHRLVLEYVDGGDLLEYVMKRRGLSASRAARVSAHMGALSPHLRLT